MIYQRTRPSIRTKLRTGKDEKRWRVGSYYYLGYRSRASWRYSVSQRRKSTNRYGVRY